ncbi:hypothetical protein [Saccharibacillus alkalitolerans]|uniref:Uncharacterized protein n=1 Tax=Saccharibacillus alkalitolerans TaxID=2705290 RepID=A0ABX0FBM1_9BACL|nr:hypothetical protein [Saccharibacillus alkalitolerans]NGZ76953.1 hypothetical protein [Saccharibacillus alkalitolerans]
MTLERYLHEHFPGLTLRPPLFYLYEWILDYDRARIDGIFGSSGSAADVD